MEAPMIRILDKTFILHTANTTYAFQVADTGVLEHLYYAGRTEWTDDSVRALAVKDNNPDGNSIAYDPAHPNLGMDNRSLEISGAGKGDFRQPFVMIEFPDGNKTTDFIYESHSTSRGAHLPSGLPGVTCTEDDAQTLHIRLKDRTYPLYMDLYYTVIEKCDCIVRSASLTNADDKPVIIKRLMSTQLDLEDSEYIFTSFHGDWTSEMNRCDTPVKGVRVVSSSNTGNSSNHSNPFVMLIRKDTSETSGVVYGFNLLYSGNHYESAESGGHFKTRFISGINPEGFDWELKKDESFETPQSVMSYSNCGYRGLSDHMHDFVKKHIVRGEYADKERPILINSWEAFYFKFTEHKLIKLAKKAAKLGIELFVLDDGWFGDRNDDTSSLGDWTVNKKKLPGGLSRLASKINKLGMQLGIWVEPEMVSENSELYRMHPDWAVKAPAGKHSTGRNQMILDLTRKEVRDNIVEQMTNVFSSADIRYVKWDMNRNFSDVYSPSLSPDRQGEFPHRYILGLYEVFDRLTKAFPHILFEGCASGGNRFDLGILCYMPQIWGSDNTDAICRKNIQNSYSYAYPQCVIGAHVSGVPNHQTLRITPLSTRYNVASFGLLGYECNLCDAGKDELAAMTDQVKIYKKWRRTLQYGRWLRCEIEGNRMQWSAVSEDRKKAVSMIVQDLARPNDSCMKLKTDGLDDSATYHVYNYSEKVDIARFGDLVNTMSPVHIRPGSLLHRILGRFVKLNGETEDYHIKGALISGSGIRLSQSYVGTGLAENTRIFGDFDSRAYYMEAE